MDHLSLHLTSPASDRSHAVVRAGVLLRVHVVLEGTDPRWWRSLELHPHLFLDQLHDVLQVLLGWPDRDRHRFAATPAGESARPHVVLGSGAVGRGPGGGPEEQVRLDDCLTHVGDRLHYLYDDGDDWWFTLELADVRVATGHAPLARCLGGSRPAPPEECGGVEGYELLTRAADPDHPQHRESLQRFWDRYGLEAVPDPSLNEPLDAVALDRQLAAGVKRLRPRVGPVPGQVADFVAGLSERGARRAAHELLADASFGQAVGIDVETATEMVDPYRWFLHHLEPRGVALTSSGFLSPEDVQVAAGALALSPPSGRVPRREADARGVRALRETAHAFGLVRASRGRLQVTERGRALMDDPAALWTHLAARMPLGWREELVRQAGLVLLLWTAAGGAGPVTQAVGAVLGPRGWLHPDGSPPSPELVDRVLGENLAVLRLVGALEPRPGRASSERPTMRGRRFARAALRL